MSQRISNVINKYKKEIILAIVATAIWELGKYIFSIFTSAGPSIVQGFIDLPYYNAAKPLGDMVAIYILGGLLVSTLSVSFTTLITSIRAYVKTRRIPEPLPIPDSIKNIARTSSEEKQSTAEKLAEEIKTLKKETKVLLTGRIRKMIMTLLMCYLLFITVLMPMTLRAMFLWHLDVISPYVETDAVLQLKSDWARMETKTEYDMISEYIGSIMDENNLR